MSKIINIEKKRVIKVILKLAEANFLTMYLGKKLLDKNISQIKISLYDQLTELKKLS